MSFDGRTFSSEKDGKRLHTQFEYVKYILTQNPGWYTLHEIKNYMHRSFRIEGSEAGISARIRDLRKPKFGAYTVEARRRDGEDGLWEYRIPNPSLDERVQRAYGR